ncbi:MAG TPA: DUF1178 family protein [Dongiaceae bacterium]|jgi:hypothetical protein
MILFDVKCAKGHVFEAWFRDSNTADRQMGRRALACPTCGNTKTAKAPMAPRIGKKGGTAVAKTEATEMAAMSAKLRKELGELRTKVESNCDYVGEKFAEEARKIHYGETDPRGIYGETSKDEARALADEGVEFARIPWLPRHDS